MFSCGASACDTDMSFHCYSITPATVKLRQTRIQTELKESVNDNILFLKKTVALATWGHDIKYIYFYCQRPEANFFLSVMCICGCYFHRLPKMPKSVYRSVWASSSASSRRRRANAATRRRGRPSTGRTSCLPCPRWASTCTWSRWSSTCRSSERWDTVAT